MPSPAEAPAVARPAPRARFPAISRGAWVASLAVHAGVLGALWLAPVPLHAMAPLPSDEPERPAFGAYIHVEESHPAFPLPQWVQACFDRTELPTPDCCLRSEYDLPESESFGYLEGANDGWAPIELANAPSNTPDIDAQFLGSAVRDCAMYASMAGYLRGRTSVFVRVERRADGTAIATTAALDDAGRHDALLCCLRQAQAPLASVIRPGGAVRFVLVLDNQQRPYPSVERAASSRGDGGPEALAMVQSAFAD